MEIRKWVELVGNTGNFDNNQQDLKAKTPKQQEHAGLEQLRRLNTEYVEDTRLSSPGAHQTKNCCNKRQMLRSMV